MRGFASSAGPSFGHRANHLATLHFLAILDPCLTQVELAVELRTHLHVYPQSRALTVLAR